VIYVGVKANFQLRIMSTATSEKVNTKYAPNAIYPNSSDKKER